MKKEDFGLGEIFLGENDPIYSITQGVPYTMLRFGTTGISCVLELQSRYFHITFHTPIGFMC